MCLEGFLIQDRIVLLTVRELRRKVWEDREGRWGVVAWFMRHSMCAKASSFFVRNSRMCLFYCYCNWKSTGDDTFSLQLKLFQSIAKHQSNRELHISLQGRKSIFYIIPLYCVCVHVCVKSSWVPRLLCITKRMRHKNDIDFGNNRVRAKHSNQTNKKRYANEVERKQ